MKRSAFVLILATACAVEVDELEDGADHAEESAEILEGDALADELAFSPAREAAEPFFLLQLLYEGPEGVGLELSTATAEGVWSEWRRVEGAALAGAWVADVVVAPPGSELAVAYRVRGAADAAAPTFLAVAPVAPAPEEEGDGDGFASTSYDLDDFAIYRFDMGRVSRPWLWLLRMARRRGWTGHLLGPRTGLRTYQEQLQLWNAYQNGTGAPAFPPWGPSRHLIRNVREHGRWYQAIDTQDVSRLITIARNHGVRLRRPYSNEPWHVEAVEKFTAPAGWSP